MEELLASSNIDNLAEGSILKGTIVEIRPTEVVVDIGGTVSYTHLTLPTNREV